MTELDDLDEDVPDWCGFFDKGQYEAFCSEVDDAAGCLGADGQDLSAGSVDLASGAYSEVDAFPLDRLAAQCRDAPQDEWNSICSARIGAWSSVDDQVEWLKRAPLDQIRERLRIHLNKGGNRFQEMDDPRKPFRIPLADGLWLGLVAEEVPGPHDDEPVIDIEVPNAAQVVAVPSRDTLITCPVPDPAFRDQVAAVVAEPARERYAEVEPGSLISPGVYEHHAGTFTRIPAAALSKDGRATLPA